MAESSGLVFVGMQGSVAAVDTASGQELWRQKLKGSGFVTLQINSDAVYAGASGELFCLDPATGAIRWQNPLTGLGRGFMSVGSSSSALISAAATEEEEEAKAVRRKVEPW